MFYTQTKCQRCENLMAERNVIKLRLGTCQHGDSHVLDPKIFLSVFCDVNYEVSALDIAMTANANYKFALLNHCLRVLHADHL